MATAKSRPPTRRILRVAPTQIKLFRRFSIPCNRQPPTSMPFIGAQCPDLIADARLHGWRHAQCAADAGKVVMHETPHHQL